MKPSVILVALITGVFLTFLAHAGFFYTWNLGLTDTLYGEKPKLDNLIIIAIDDKSIQEIGRWPWDRTKFADLLHNTAGAKLIAFDIGFFEPTADDYILGDAMRQSGNVVIAKEYDFTRKVMLSPTPGFENITTGIVNIYTDQDSVSRSIPVSIDNQTSMALVIAQKYLGREITVPSKKILINYAGGPGTYRTYSAVDVIAGRVDPHTFDDAILFIGATAPDLHDDYVVPTSHGKRMPGVEIHAHSVQTLLTKQFLSTQSFKSLAITIMVISLVAGLIYAILNIWYGAAILFIIAVGYFVYAIQSFKQGLILNLVYPPITMIVASMAATGYIAASEARHKKYILGIFGRYVSKDVVKHLLKNEKSIQLGGEEREITAMFADIRGFTSMSEKMTPHQVITFLNHYFGDMTDLIFAHGGTLDKYVGDALFAIWGSPLPDKDHAYNAVKCALAIQEKLKTQHRKDIPKINLGIGICSGPAVVGNMGSKQRQEFTAIGDTVNTSSRLSGTASGGQIMITESTYKLIEGRVDVKKLEPLKVKGKEKPLIVYEVLGLHNPAK